jgi:hypothetical protein
VATEAPWSSSFVLAGTFRAAVSILVSEQRMSVFVVENVSALEQISSSLALLNPMARGLPPISRQSTQRMQRSEHQMARIPLLWLADQLNAVLFGATTCF